MFDCIDKSWAKFASLNVEKLVALNVDEKFEKLTASN